MSKKENFIELVQLLMDREKFNFDDPEWAGALDYWNALQISEDKTHDDKKEILRKKRLILSKKILISEKKDI